MARHSKARRMARKPKLRVNELNEIERKIQFDTAKLFHSMVKLGAVSNLIGALLYVAAIYNTTLPQLVISWYAFLFIVNVINVYWATRFESKKITLEQLLVCRKGLLINLIVISLIWGSCSILFMTNGYQQQITTIIFLAAVLICFTFSTAIDLTMGVCSILCLVIPTIIHHTYLAIHLYTSNTLAYHLAITIAMSFLIMGLFMLVANIFANKIIIKVFRLGYENMLLTRKLGTINFTLEKNVKERTTELQNSLNLVSYQSTHDLLTELPNERSLHEYIHDVTERAIKEHYKFALACFSLNGMEKIKDGLGHQASLTIIKRIAQRLKNQEKLHDNCLIFLSRQDVFNIVIEKVYDDSEIEKIVKSFFNVLNDPVLITDQTLKLTGSVGVCTYPADGRDLDTLITNAESARVLASKYGGNSIRIYHTIINANAYRQLNIENELYYALENNELVLHYQPFVDLRTETVSGAEALIRWKSPLLGMLSPIEFITIAEANGMILPIGEWILRTACQQLKKLHQMGFNKFTMSVNLSAKQLAQKNLVEQISKILEQIEIAPKFLKLELTESQAFQKEAIPIIHRFTEMGISLAIDDFGTGYSDFTHFKFFKIDQIKIDKLFIQDIDVNVDSRHIVCNTIALASRMNIDCLAEGVENLEQVKFLKDNGCFTIQGYYFSKPLCAEDFDKFIVSSANGGIKDKLQY